MTSKAQARTVLTYGTFDMFHVGHVRLIQRLTELGERLIVGVSTDEFNLQKGKRAIFTYPYRAEIISSLKGVDHVIPEETWDQKLEDIQRHDVDLLVMGEDWAGKFDYLSNTCEVRYLPRTRNVSTTSIKAAIDRLSSIGDSDLVSAVEILEFLNRDLT
ncbi:adenylyltransferase/cytidyltransferase family protein [Wenzhouxiangella sp. EGI_FJ10305]|uniref:adenylyltransferase/cytidyltransferase family protein n=1 Tax=Wenzhouxiangella sp. EGI_FJ10305 TaxID=3243768 RepID=UPI0035DF682A